MNIEINGSPVRFLADKLLIGYQMAYLVVTGKHPLTKRNAIILAEKMGLVPEQSNGELALEEIRRVYRERVGDEK